MGIGLLSGREWNNTYSGGYSPFSAKGDKFAEKWLAKFAPEYANSGGTQPAKSGRNMTTAGTATAYSCSAAVSFRRDVLIGSVLETEKREYTKTLLTNNTTCKKDKVFYTYYSEEGIRCVREGKRDPDNPEEKIEEDIVQWELKFDSPKQYEKAMSFLADYPQEDNLIFVTKKEFWTDLFDGKIDMEGFQSYYEWTDHGTPNLLKGNDGEITGRFNRDKIIDPNAKYFNDQTWIRDVGEAERAFDRFAPYAPESVKQAWLAAAQEAGIDGLGISASGKMNHITQFTVQQALRRMRGEDKPDVLGSTVQSAIRATDEALYALNQPLEPRSAEKKKNVEKERMFYQKFLEKLQGLDKTSAGMGMGENDAVTAPDISEEMSDDPEESESASKADIIVKPDGTRVLVITTNIGGMEMTMNLKIAEPTNEPYEMGEKI